MSGYRIVIQNEQRDGSYDNGEVVYTGNIHHPSTIMQLGLRHHDQIDVLRNILNALLKQQSVDLQEAIQFCPKCGYELKRNGVKCSSFSSIFTDHKVPVHKLKCTHCQWESVPSVSALFGTHLHPDLVKLQCEHGSKASYTSAQKTLNNLSARERSVNNTMSLRDVVEVVGSYISEHPDTQISESIVPADELVVQVDGGHVKSKIKGDRSFEALTTVVYKPDAVVPGKKKRLTGTIKQKHCAASALDDDGLHINHLTLVSAQKEGLTKNTQITALCDGAINCWNIIDSLTPHCASTEAILDWFHIAKKFQNTRMGEKYNVSLAKAKWSLWHNDVETALTKITALKNKVRNHTKKEKLAALYQYIDNNRHRLVNYGERYRQGKVFTSQMAESTVESLINQRCKGKRHMQWSREGLHPVLQLRATIASNDWSRNCEDYIMGAYSKIA